MAPIPQEIEAVKSILQEVLEPVGFEYHPFKIEWYNDQVSQHFKLDYPADTLAFVVISTPSLFEKGFIPFIKNGLCDIARDPIDGCVAHYFSEVKKCLDRPMVALHDFELTHTRRPKVLVQTAGHVAGAAHYYRRSDVTYDPWGPDKQIFGVSVHPVYGGWFALRGVLVLPGLECPDLQQKAPQDVLPDDISRIDVLSKFNGNWRDWTYRDVIPVKERYSELQKLYYATPPRERKSLIDKVRDLSPEEILEIHRT